MFGNSTRIRQTDERYKILTVYDTGSRMAIHRAKFHNYKPSFGIVNIDRQTDKKMGTVLLYRKDLK